MLVNLIPDALVRLFAAPYVAGDRMDDGLEVAHRLLDQASIQTTLDLLAEEVSDEHRVAENHRAYLDLIDALGKDPRFADKTTRPTVSVKLSSFTLAPLEKGGDASGSREHMLDVAAHAKAANVALSIDMEDRHWTDFTLDIARELFLSGHDVGAVLQTRLHRTEADIESLPEGMRVRMVIGIYQEPATDALTQKREMKERLLVQSARLLDRGLYVEFASHDQEFLRRFLEDVVTPRKLDGDRYELQMLYGVPRATILAEILSGNWTPSPIPPTVRLYVPYATDWSQATAYCRRRLAANPGLGLYVFRNLLGSLGSLGSSGKGIAPYVSALGKIREEQGV